MASNTFTRAEPELLAQRHAMFALRSLKFLPTPYQAEDNQRMSLAYFCLSAMALLPSSAVSNIDPSLAAIDVLLKPEQVKGYIDWVYRLQVPGGGFQGSDSLAGAEMAEELLPAPIPLDSKEAEDFARLMAYPDSDDEECGAGEGKARPRDIQSSSTLAPPNLIQSYTALLVLGLLADDFKRVNRAGLLRFLARCQQNDGSFLQFPECPEPGDPRSTYSAFAIASILDDWTAIDVDRALDFLGTCQRPEGGFAARPFAEPQGGFAYCAIASYFLASRISSLPNSTLHLRWLVDLQVRPPPPDSESTDSDTDDQFEEGEAQDMAGFQGRSGKDADACYSFWVTAALRILRPELELLQPALDQRWLLSCQHKQYGGIAREPGALPDVFHTYLSLAALALSSTPSAPKAASSHNAAISLDLRPLNAAWNVSSAVAERIRATIAALPKLHLDRP